MKRLAFALMAAGLLATPARASEEAGATPDAKSAAAPAPAPQPDLDDLEADPSEPDFTVVNTPTTLRVPRHKWAFRLTHRFSRPLGEGDFDDLLEDFFRLDSAAGVGLELRFAPAAGTQLGIYRTNGRTIELFLEQNVIGFAKGPLGLTLFGSVEGIDNFTEEHSPAAGVVVSRRLKDRGALYAFAAWVGNTRQDEGGGDDATFLLGLSLVAEFAPRLAGYRGANPEDLSRRAVDDLTFGIEKRAGRPLLPAQLLERLRHHSRPARPRVRDRPRLFHRLQPFEEVLLAGPPAPCPRQQGLRCTERLSIGGVQPKGAQERK